MDLKVCNHCGKSIPSARRKDAKYCSSICYLHEKAARDSRNYYKCREYLTELSNNERTLSKFYGIAKGNNGGVPVEFIVNEGFVWDRYDELIKVDDGYYKRVGYYAFCLKNIDGHQRVLICKLKEFQ